MRGAAVVTGASSGIGRALALELAARGHALGLAARREPLLHALAAEIAARHPAVRVVVRALDVTDPAAVHAAMGAFFEALDPVSLVVANAGLGGTHPVGRGAFDRARAIVETNLVGAMATVDAAVEAWRARPGSGPRRIAGITSVAGFRGLPGSAAYSASKAGLATYLEAVRVEVRPLGIDVVDVAPGYIDTPINRDMASRPFLIDDADGARRIVDLLDRGVYRSTVPVWPWTAIGWVMRALPDAVWIRVAGGAHRGRD